MKLFSKPKGGWVNINIGDYVIDASDLTDVPVDYLNALIASLKYEVPICVYIDEEGREDIICVIGDMLTISIMEDRRQVDFKTLKIDYNAFVKEIILGVEEYFDHWVKWSIDDDEEKLKLRAKKLQGKINEAKEIVQELDIKF